MTGDPPNDSSRCDDPERISCRERTKLSASDWAEQTTARRGEAADRANRDCRMEDVAGPFRVGFPGYVSDGQDAELKIEDPAGRGVVISDETVEAIETLEEMGERMGEHLSAAMGSYTPGYGSTGSSQQSLDGPQVVAASEALSFAKSSADRLFTFKIRPDRELKFGGVVIDADGEVTGYTHEADPDDAMVVQAEEAPLYVDFEHNQGTATIAVDTSAKISGFPTRPASETFDIGPVQRGWMHGRVDGSTNKATVDRGVDDQ